MIAWLIVLQNCGVYVLRVQTLITQTSLRHDYTIGTLDVLQACDACADMGMTCSVIVQCTDYVVFPVDLYSALS